MKGWQKAVLLLLITICAVLGHVALMYTLDALGWDHRIYIPFRVLIYTVIACAVKGVTES